MHGHCVSSIVYAVPVPDAMRTPGIHRFQFHASIVLDGVPTDLGVVENQITISSDAPSYPRTVNLQLFDNVTLVNPNDWDETPVTEMRPDQDARFRVGAYSAKDDPYFVSFELRLRYETSPGVWTDEMLLDHGPYVSTCTVISYGFIHRSFGVS